VIDHSIDLDWPIGSIDHPIILLVLLIDKDQSDDLSVDHDRLDDLSILLIDLDRPIGSTNHPINRDGSI
jgi:hypothetical protein